MPKDRFSEFVFKVERLNKCLKKLEMMTAERLGIKEVHIFWIYALIDHPEGLTASELARINSINRSLVSREIKELEKKNIIRYRSSGSADNKYNAKIVLTEKGIDIARAIYHAGIRAQVKARRRIAKDDLRAFYSVLDIMTNNLLEITNPNQN